MSGKWDLIVVGAGSTGAVVAARAAGHGLRVLLLEAGPDYRSSETPPEWKEPNPSRILLSTATEQDLLWPDLKASRTDHQDQRWYLRGRGVGGSSAINGQIAIRPPMEDFAEWTSEGCEGWSPEDILPYFNKLEDDEEFGSLRYHGANGPVPIFRTPLPEWGPVDDALRRASLAAGHCWAPDVNAPGATGVSPYPINSRNSVRVSTNDAYLEPKRGCRTLEIRGCARVDRVLFEADRAVGVEVSYRDNSTKSRREFAAEIVLAAGAIHSPSILMRSGIGPYKDLKAMGIDVRADLPVGQGLQEHPAIMLAFELSGDAARWPLSNRHTNCCVRFTSKNKYAQFNDMMMASLNRFEHAGRPCGAVTVWLNQCHSRGVLSLESPDPGDQPRVRQRMLSDERDLVRLREGFKHLAELIRSPELRTIISRSPDEVDPEGWAALGSTDRSIDKYLLANVFDGQHVTSTCKMGPADDKTAVVDSECRVFGLDGLRVADASVFPAVPRANTHLISVMLGEKVADHLTG